MDIHLGNRFVLSAAINWFEKIVVTNAVRHVQVLVAEKKPSCALKGLTEQDQFLEAAEGYFSRTSQAAVGGGGLHFLSVGR